MRLDYLLLIQENKVYMAFVYRSQKISPFKSNSISPNKQLRQTEAIPQELRIHEKDPALKKLSAHKKCTKPKKRKSVQAVHPSIPNKQKIFDSAPPNIKKNRKYNFRFLKKSRVESGIKKNFNQEFDFNQKDKKQFYDLPGSLSHKTMVKYRKNVNNSNPNKISIQSPGPGAYNPQLPVCNQAPVFRDTTNFETSLLKNNDSQQIEQKSEQNLFAVKYNYMNSSVFKKSLNLRKISNKILLAKLFSSQKNLTEKENISNDQFSKVRECRPGPGSYNEITKYKNAPSFGNAQRFQDKVKTDGSNKFYDISAIENKDVSQSSCFCSEAKRFQEDKVITTSLQHVNYQNSFIKDSYNRKGSGFKLDLGRIGQKSMDQRPYYELSQGEKREFMTKFYKYEAKRELFHINSQNSPGPEDYNTCLSWRKEHSCIIKNDGHKQESCSLPGSEPCQVNFYLCSQQNFNKNDEKISKGVLKSSKLFVSPTHVPQPPSPQKYYNTAPSWQIKSFNQHFINQILPANNPIKNKIL